MPKKKIGLSAWLLGVNIQQFIIQNTQIQQNRIYLTFRNLNNESY